MNKHIPDSEIQDYILEHLHADVHKIAMGKSHFPEVSGKELANQIAAKKKSMRKLPTWFGTEKIYYPALLSIEQCSSEVTAAYKATLAVGREESGRSGSERITSDRLTPLKVRPAGDLADTEIKKDAATTDKTITTAEKTPDTETISAETSAKNSLSTGKTLIDLTGGYGVDSYYFSKVMSAVIHCELNPELSAIAAYNSVLLNQENTTFYCGDSLAYLHNSTQHFDCIYIDPARRSDAGKVFMLKDCTPNVIANLSLLLEKSDRILIKTAPLLDLTAGLKELQQVSEIHIVSVKNECKELIWIIEKNFKGRTKIVSTTLNAKQKQFSFHLGDEAASDIKGTLTSGTYLYEPDVALLKSGAFNLIADRYNLQKFHQQTQLYVSDKIHPDFPGRIFSIEQVISTGALKKEKNLTGSVIVRNYPDKAASLVDKYQIKPDDTQFIIFSQSSKAGKIVIRCTIIQHY